jgi:predicted CoA-substrate-specific enzyme activase
MSERFIGIDMGAETIKVVELTQDDEGQLRWSRRHLVEHHKEPGKHLLELLSSWGWDTVRSAAVSGRLGRQVNLSRIPTKQAQSTGYRFLHSDDSATVVSIGCHGFSVLEMRPSGIEVFRENSRCSQGTGNFLRQLVERFNMSIEEASILCEEVEDPAPLSGRCPVILKTDMTHLANKGESRPRILAGLYDAVCENVQVLIKPKISPPKVVLIGGVARSERIRRNFSSFLFKHEMALSPTDDDDALFFEALGSASIAAQRAAESADVAALPALDRLVQPSEEASLEFLPALNGYLGQVKRMEAPPLAEDDGRRRQLLLGFDIGSTGSKVVAVDAGSSEMVWQGYVNTNGNPVGAAQTLMQQFVDGPAAKHDVLALGATGSGREIVGSLMSTCYGHERVFVLNEIAAHAEGAMRYDPRVDTIFEIGGQDAKYIRLAEGRVVDAAMNEACSAGTGSFIEEQGRKFSGIEDVVQLGDEATQAERGVSLGQHCSVFMAEIIDEAVAAGVEQRTIIAGIYDSIIQNYLNRVKGSRSVGDVIFCQGMPFSSDALAAAVARQTGSEVIIPPNPGTVGALGICLLALKELQFGEEQALAPGRFLRAEMLKKDTFVCKSDKGCGGAGNKCRIDRIKTRVEGQKQRFTWGGGCSLYDSGTGKRKLPDRTPDPFREREAMVQQIIDRVSQPRGGKTVALTDEFVLKSLFPFFATFIHELGFDLDVTTGANQAALKRGIEEANVPFCAPMQQYHGIVSAMNDRAPDFLFLPMMRGICHVKDEPTANVCPIVQGNPDMLRWDLGENLKTRLLDTVFDIGAENLRSQEFSDSCQRLVRDLEAKGADWRRAFEAGVAAQERFDARCLELGQEALSFCEEQGIVPVVVLGRAYTIYNTVLNSNVPTILREQGSVAIPVECYPVEDEVPVFRDMYWGYGQRNLRAAHQLRRRPGVYSLFCSNYSCGPDSFNLHFYSYMMEGKPYAIIETDGHSGDAGTKTRVEAFLYCVREDLQRAARVELVKARPNDFKLIELDKENIDDIERREELLLIPRMGPGAAALAACIRGLGMRAECLPTPDRETVRIGRRYTSGKECVPMVITLGSLLQRIERDRDAEERFAFFMPCASGPCRFGVYNLLHKITLERLDWKDRVRIWSPTDKGYFKGIPAGFTSIIFTGFMTMDLLLECLYHTRPVETRPGAAREIYERYSAELIELLEREAKGDLSAPTAIYKTATGQLFGCTDLLRRAATEFAAVKAERELPEVLVVGEIYVRCDKFANDYIIDRLEDRGIRARFSPFNEWLEYVDWIQRDERKYSVSKQLRHWAQSRTQQYCYDVVAKILGWGHRTTVADSLAAAAPYVRDDLDGEAVLTVGGPVHEWREGEINGVVSVGPLECMPNKLSESQFFHVAEQEGLPSVTLSLNGDPVDPEVLDNFAFEVHEQFRRIQRGEEVRRPRPGAPEPPLQRLRRAMESFNPLGRRPTTSAPAPVVEDRTGRVEVEEQPKSRETTPASLLASLTRNVRPRPRS